MALLLKVDEVADVLGVSVRTVWRLSKAELPPVRIGPQTVRWKRQSVEAFVEALPELGEKGGED